MKMEFNNNGEVYTAEVIGNNFVTNGLKVPLIMLRINNSDNEAIGCVAFTQSLLLRIGSANSEFNNEQKIIYCISLLNRLPFYPDKLKELYPGYFEYFFSRDQEGLSNDGKTYNIKENDGLVKTGEGIHFGKQPTDKKIRKAILVALYNHWKKDQDTHVPIKYLLAMVPVDGSVLVRNLKHLTEDEKIKPLYETVERIKIISARITIKGRKEIEGEIEKNNTLEVKYIHMGDNISASSSGDSSPVIVKGQNITIAYGILDNLKTEIDEKYKGEDKETVLQEVAEVKKLTADPKNKSAITAKLGGLLAKTAQFATIANLIIQALKLHAGI